MDFVSIIITHWSMNEYRSKTMTESLQTLFDTTRNTPCEIIVIDNQSRKEDSEHLIKLLDEGKIATYVRNQQNMSFGYARNQGLNLCQGNYICIADNDIIYNHGWLEACLAVLNEHPEEKIYATPIYNVAHWRAKYWSPDTLQAGGRPYRLNRRAGSNCWVTRRRDMERLGDFWVHRIAGTKWTDNAYRNGYWAAVTPDIMVNDMGFRRGYQLNQAIPIFIKLSNGEEIYFNSDEYKDENPGKNYMIPKRFIPNYQR